MAKDFTADVLVCGAGAAGLTLALDLARRGVSFRVINKSPEPFHGSRGKGIQPRTQEVFEDLGILDKVVAAGGLYPMMRVYGADGGFADKELGESTTPTAAEPYHIPLMIPQSKTEAIMRDRLAELGAEVQFWQELVGFKQDDEGVIAQISGPEGVETQRFRYLIGADGGRSFVRKVLGFDFPGKTLGVRAMVADVSLTGLSRERWHQFNDGDMQRMINICPLGGTELFQIQAPVAPEGPVDLSVEALQRMIADRTGREDIHLHEVHWASAYAMNARLAERYRDGRVFLIGDAAHIHPPTGGQGLNTSVQDAYNLGWKLAAVLNGASEDLLDSYEQERRPVAAEVLGLSTRLLDASQRGEVRRGREVSQLDIGYPGTTISLQSAARAEGLQVGDRAPDAPILGAAGQPTRLFQLLCGPHWTLLIHGDIPFAARKGLHIHRLGERGDIKDAGNHLHEAYGLAKGEYALIRPDGYIAAISLLDPQGAARLDGFLNFMGLAATAEGFR
ncbi:MAG: FAD-binding protein [Paracoccus sp. BP8]|nr:MAG: FAD-binding protein [Paracoccus sp. BP8]